MGDIVFHHISHEKGGQEYSRHGIHEIEIVFRRGREVGGEQRGDEMDDIFEELGRQAAEQSDHQGEEHQKTAFLEMALAPGHYLEPPFGEFIMSFFICHRFWVLYRCVSFAFAGEYRPDRMDKDLEVDKDRHVGEIYQVIARALHHLLHRGGIAVFHHSP